MASKFDEEKRVLINDLSEEKAAHMQTLELLAEERRKSSMIPKYEQELSSLRTNFEDVQKMLIQSQKKQVEERNKTVVSNQQIEHLQMQLEQMQEANDKTQTLLEESMQELDEHKALIQSNPNLQEIQEASSELSMLRERVAQLESALTTTQEENARMTSLLATAQAERDRAVEEMRGSKTSITTLQAQLEEAMFNLEMSSETIKDLNTQLAALGVSPTTEDSPALTRSTATLLEQENSRLMEDINSLKANLVATETRLTRTTKQLNAFRLSASHDAKRNQATITSLQHKIAGFSDFPSPSSTPEPPASPSPTPKQQPNGVYESDSEGENGDTSRIREAEENKREIEALQHQLRDAQAELEALRAKTDADQRTIHDTQDLRMQYELSQTELEAMRADLERVEKELDRKQTEAYTLRTQLAEELESLHGQVSQLQEALRKEEQINSDLTQELERERAKESSGGRQEEVDALREQLQRAQEAHDNLLRAASDDEVVSLRAKVDESEGEMEKLREEVERLKDNLETETHMNSELTKLVEQEKSNRSAHGDAKEAEINVLREKLRDSDKDLHVQAQQYHQKMEQSAQELSELKRDLDRITAEYNASTNQMTQAQGELDKSREQFLELQGKLEKAMLDNMELEKKLEERMGDEEAETLHSQLQQSHDDFEKATDANAELERQLEHALNDLDTLRAGMKEGEGKDEQLDALREELNQLLAAKAELAKKLEEEKSKSRARDLQVGSELEELQAQVKENEKIAERLAQAKDNLEKATSANAELEKQYNAKQVELNTHRAQALAQEREMELLRVELLQSKDVIEKVKDTSLDLERRLEEERNRNVEDENKGVDQEQIDALKLQLKEAQDALESEIQTKLDNKQGEQNKVKREADDLERRNTEFERHLALLRAEEGVLRAQLQAAQEEIAESNMLIEEQERERETVDQEREELASMLEGLQRANEELENKVRKYETLKLNGKQESPRKVTIQEEAKSSSSESDQEAERESEEIIEDEADEVERDEEVVNGEEQEEEEIEDDEEEEDEKEELVAELQEQIKDEQQRTTNLVQAIYTLQIELQQEKAKQSEMDTALVELQKGNQRLTQEVYDLRNAWTESSFFNSSFTSDKGISSLISEIPKESSIVSPTSSASPRKKDGNIEWDGLENEIKRAAGLRAVALRTILEDLENAKEKDVKMANLRTQQFQLIDKLNDTEVELAESRHIVANLQAEFDSAKRSIEEHKSAKELASKLAQLEQHNAALNARLETALAETAEVESGHTSKMITLESQIVNREQHNASINERLKEALGLATDAEEEHIKTVFALEDKIEKLEAENESLVSRMGENDQAALALIAAQEDYRKLVSALEDKQGELEAYNANLNKELDNAKEEIKKLLEDNDTLERNAVSLAVHTNTTARDLEDSVASAKSELAEANEELEILRSERDGNIKALKMLVAERENANEEVRILLAEREKIMEKLEDLEKLADNAEVLEVRNSGLQRQIEDLETQLRESARTKREISGPLSRSSSFSESFDAKRMVSESESLEHRNAALATMTDELRQRINELESNPDEIETLSQEVATLEEERNALAVLNRKLEKECKKLREQSKSPKNDVPIRNVSEDSEARVSELEEEIDSLREKIRKQEELHESFVVSTEEERAVNHSNFVNLQTALRDEKDNLANLEKQISVLKLENAKLQALPADDKLSELREVHLANSKLREELVYTKSQCAQLKVETDALGRIQTEMGKLKDEMNEERHKAKKWKKENKELKEECRELKRDRFMERELTSSKIGREMIPSGELGNIKEEYATLRGECKVLREDRNIWREECSKAKDETKKWRDNVSALELEMREVKIVHHEEVQLIASLKRENELLRRDNEMLWEQMDAWGGLDGLGKGAKDNTNNTNTNNINIDGISTILHPDSLNDASLKEDRSKLFKDKKEVKEGQQEDNNNKEEKEEGKEEEEDTVNTSEELTRSHLGTSTTTNSSSRASRVEPSPIPTNPPPRLQPDYSRTFTDEQLPFEESGIDTQGVMFEAQSLAHYRTNAMILSQMEKLASKLHTLVQNARSTSNAQSAHHNAHLAHAVAQASAERDATLRLRDAYENDSQRIQEASLEALRAHVNGIKSVYNALSY